MQFFIQKVTRWYNWETNTLILLNIWAYVVGIASHRKVNSFVIWRHWQKSGDIMSRKQFAPRRTSRNFLFEIILLFGFIVIAPCISSICSCKYTEIEVKQDFGHNSLYTANIRDIFVYREVYCFATTPRCLHQIIQSNSHIFQASREFFLTLSRKCVL
jgi:hypothetical protein